MASRRPGAGRLALALLLLAAAAAMAEVGRTEGDPWLQLDRPGAGGWSEERLESAFETAREAGSAAVMIVHRGRVVAAWGDVEKPLPAHSIRKPLFGAVFGLAVEEDAIDLESTLSELGIDDSPPLTAREKQARVVDLLSGRSGVYHPAAYETPGKRAERPPRGAHPPGSHFWSNNWDFNTLLTIYESSTGKGFFRELERTIAGPIGMEDFRAEDGELFFDERFSVHPAYPLRVSTRDLARFGQLVLGRGVWKGRRILPADWVRRSTQAHTVFGEKGGYTGTFRAGAGFGYLWWIYPGSSQPEDRPALGEVDAVAAQGSGGHLLLLVPERDLVVVHRAPTDSGGPVSWDSVWRIAELVVGARIVDGDVDPELVPLAARPLSSP